MEAQCAGLGELEVERVKTLMRRAKERMQVIGGATMPYAPGVSWLENSLKFLESGSGRRLAGLVVAPRDPPTKHHSVFEFNDFELPPTSEETMRTTPEVFVRVSGVLLRTSAELGFVDPYLDPCKPYCSMVLKEMFRAAAAGKCESIRLWCRRASPLSERDEADLRAALLDLLPKTERTLKLRLSFVDDTRSRVRMHARYLLTMYGGIRFDQGFQQLRDGRAMDVAPIAPAVFDEAWRTFFENRNDFRWASPPIMVVKNASNPVA